MIKGLTMIISGAAADMSKNYSHVGNNMTTGQFLLPQAVHCKSPLDFY
jgi:hypothetical protein